MSSRIYAHAARRIRELRRSRRLALEEVADRAKIAPSYLGQIERMERKPSLLTLAMIASALQVEPSHILEGQDTTVDKMMTAVPRLTAILAGLSDQHKELAIQTIQFFLRRLRRLERARSI